MNKCFSDFFRVLDRLGPRAMSAHLRLFTEYLVLQLSSSTGGIHVNKVGSTIEEYFIPFKKLEAFLLLLLAESHQWTGVFKYTVIVLGQLNRLSSATHRYIH